MKSVPSCAVDDASAKLTTACLISSLAWISVRIAVLKASDVKRSLIAVLFWHSQLWSVKCLSNWAGCCLLLLVGIISMSSNGALSSKVEASL